MLQMTSPLPFLDFAVPGFSTRSEEVDKARDENWCARTPYGLAILRHREAGLLLRENRLRQGSYAWPDIHGLEGSFAAFWKRSLIGQEGDIHSRLRTIATGALSAGFVEGLKPQFDKAADQLVRSLAQRRSCELMEDFCTPFAGQAICILLGLPTNDWETIARDATALGLAMGMGCKSHEAEFNAACDRLMALADKLIAIARKNNGNRNYVSRIVAGFAQDTELTEQHLRDLIVISIFGGVDTTQSQLGICAALFADYHDQWQHLRNDHSLAPNAIEDSIRARPTTTWATREAICDFTFQDQQVDKGETLHILVHASARDPKICDDPAFDITAKRKVHFGFGGGAHHCIGHLVARTDMECALLALARHIESLAWDGKPEWLPDSGNTGPTRLPLSIIADAHI